MNLCIVQFYSEGCMRCMKGDYLNDNLLAFSFTCKVILRCCICVLQGFLCLFENLFIFKILKAKIIHKWINFYDTLLK